MDRKPTPSPAGERPPEAEEFLEDVLAGLAAPPYALPAKYLYDRRGSQLFDRICQLEAYYPTRTELRILESHAGTIGESVGPEPAVVELGSGSSNKTGILLESLEDPVAYIPVEISREHLDEASRRVGAAYPGLEVLPVWADYTRDLTLPGTSAEPRGRLIYFPGSTIGNFEPEEAAVFLRRLAGLAGTRGALLLGVDLSKDRRVLERAYNDPQGVTAEFNRNLLARLERELDAELDSDSFYHQAVFNEGLGCIEMHLVSRREQAIRVGGRTIPFEKGQTIRTERSYKYSLEGFARLAERGGWTVYAVWTDDRQWFSVQLLVPAGGARTAG